MYIRRKVFSLGEGNIDYDYNLYQALYSDYEEDYFDPTYDEVERFYSDSFDEGFDFYAQKMFGEFNENAMKNHLLESERKIASLNEDLDSAISERDEARRIGDEYSKKFANERGAHVQTLKEKKAIEEAAEEAAKQAKEAAKQAKAKQEGLEKSLKRWKVGAGIGAGVAGLGGLGAYLYNRNKDR